MGSPLSQDWPSSLSLSSLGISNYSATRVWLLSKSWVHPSSLNLSSPCRESLPHPQCPTATLPWAPLHLSSCSTARALGSSSHLQTPEQCVLQGDIPCLSFVLQILGVRKQSWVGCERSWFSQQKGLCTLTVPVLEEKVERHCCTSTDLIRAGRR